MKKKLKILIVDDEQIVLDSVKKLLKRENFILYTTLSAKEALIIMRKTKINILLTDLMLPEMDGLELMDEAKKIAPNIPMILITGYATINAALQATHLEAFDYIAKPFTKSELLSVVKRARDMVITSKNSSKKDKEADLKELNSAKKPVKSLGQNSWMMLEDDGVVIIGAHLHFLRTIGTIQNIFLPSEGDELHQGGVYIQLASSDIRSHTLTSPLSGTVVEINKKILENTEILTEDAYGEGWLIRLKPSRFEFEIKTLGL
jgi:FixJ family two-component response regulator